MKYISLSQISENRLRRDYVNQHSRFVHSSWLLLEDLDKEVEILGRNYRIAGLWDVLGYKKIILLKNIENGTYAHTDSKDVANALGFTKFRNLVTGKEITYDLADEAKVREWLNKSKISETVIDKTLDDSLDDSLDEVTDEVNTEDEDDKMVLDRDNEYVEEDEEEVIETDPLVKALQIDEDDSGWIEDNENE